MTTELDHAPLIAIIGRPNVGKSALFNRITRTRRALVEEVAGTTRDRIYGFTEWRGRYIRVVDTGGVEGPEADPFSPLIREQVLAAIEEADLAVFVVDAGEGLSSADQAITDLLRRAKCPVLLVGNKADRKGARINETDLYALGLGEPLMISAYHGQGIGDLLDRILDLVPRAERPDEPERLRIAVVGRPNVGKSTLLNALVGQKVSITSNKAQTTRHRINGIRTVGSTQFVFIDTPGFQTRHAAALNRTLNRTVQGALGDVDVVLFVVEAGRFGLDDAKVLSLVAGGGEHAPPVFLVANKLDAVHRRAELAPWLKSMQERHAFAEFVPLSARKATDVQRLLGIVEPYLPKQDWFYEEDALTDRSERFLASEIIREKLFRLTGDELPYTSTVVIDKFEEEGKLRRIAASIVVERDAHKGMVIGDGGAMLKRIGSESRQELETLMGGKVFLELWVKVRSGWADDEEHLRSYGYE